MAREENCYIKEEIEDIITMFYLVINSSSNIHSGETLKTKVPKRN